MINVNGIAISHGGEYLFSDVTFLINDRDRIGLVGRNGTGKSTILKILAGMISTDEGSIAFPRECTIGYLQQDLTFKSGRTVFEETASALEEIKRLEARVHDLTEKVTNTTDFSGDDYMDLLQELHDAQEHLHLLEAGNQEEKIEKVLLGLGFEREQFHNLVSTFSGGWQMRVELAKILLKQPTLLLLDEPTNHLDIESIQWLEEFLSDYPGAIIIVSHDKRFLDNLTNRTIEISLGKIEDYKAPYSKYIQLRKERREATMNAYKNQQNDIRQTEMLIEKFRAKANKAKMAQSLIKQLDRMDKIELEDEDNSAMRFRFPDAPRSGVVVAEAKSMTKQYGDKVILKNIGFQINRNDRVAFVGRNGEGKTTLTKIINGEEPFTGDCQLGYNVKVGYYAQHQAEKLNGNMTVYDTVDHLAPHDMRPRLRNLLGSFLFGGNDVDKKVKVLSGGEKSRLALACLLLEPSNLLILDEPTNHLDMRSKDV
ncbi:MAG TPA: glycosyl transferase family 2, partial [Bacteroidetes bacterium]|nr:glycosyl transferase family 2 [Bacteroidota bacterium]